jgi:hypothetical protein
MTPLEAVWLLLLFIGGAVAWSTRPWAPRPEAAPLPESVGARIAVLEWECEIRDESGALVHDRDPRWPASTESAYARTLREEYRTRVAEAKAAAAKAERIADDLDAEVLYKGNGRPAALLIDGAEVPLPPELDVTVRDDGGYYVPADQVQAARAWMRDEHARLVEAAQGTVNEIRAFGQAEPVAYIDAQGNVMRPDDVTRHLSRQRAREAYPFD